jgi:hypothetical protein
MGKLNYKEDLDINPDALDLEWLRQSSLMMKYTKLAAKANREVDRAKEKLDVTKAGLDKAIRKDPQQYEIEKLTEGSVFAAIIVQGSYTEDNGLYLQAKYEADMAKGAVRALEHKKDSLEGLVKLYLSGYFSGPNVPKMLNRGWEQEEKQKSSDEKVASKFNNRKREK